MTDTKGLIERARQCRKTQREGVLSVPDTLDVVDELADALEAALARESKLRAEVERLKAQAVAVKPLIWGHHPAGLIASTGMGSAYIIDTREASRPRWLKWPDGYGLDRDTLEGMQAAAQADYEARILSAITIRSASDVAAEARAGAIEEAADTAYQWWDDEDAQELRDTIRALHDIDTLAAIERIKDQARQEERERCANIAEDLGCWFVPEEITAEIREGE